jgi:hypothetical protein
MQVALCTFAIVQTTSTDCVTLVIFQAYSYRQVLTLTTIMLLTTDSEQW